MRFIDVLGGVEWNNKEGWIILGHRDDDEKVPDPDSGEKII
jgi:hypothetical protein